MTTDQANLTEYQNLWEKIKDVRITMMTTADDEDAGLRSRPMYTQQVDFDGEL